MAAVVICDWKADAGAVGGARPGRLEAALLCTRQMPLETACTSRGTQTSADFTASVPSVLPTQLHPETPQLIKSPTHLTPPHLHFWKGSPHEIGIYHRQPHTGSKRQWLQAVAPSYFKTQQRR